MEAPDIRNLLMGRGEIRFARFDENGVANGFLHLGNCLTLETSFEDTEEAMANMMSNTGGDYRKVTTRREGTCNITMSELNPENLALIVSGRTSTFDQAGGAVVAEELTDSAVLGRWYVFAERGTKANPITLVTVDQGAQELVLDEDYLLDTERGMIYLVPDGPNVAAGVATTVDYTSPALTDLDVVHLGSDQIEGMLYYVGNPVVGPVFEVELWKVKLSPEGVLGLITESFAEPQLSGTILDDSANHPEPDQFGKVTYTGERR